MFTEWALVQLSLQDTTPHVGRKPGALSSQRICISEGVASGDVAPCDKSPSGHNSPGKEFYWLYGFPVSSLVDEHKMGEWEETQFKNTEGTKRKPMTYHVLDCHI